MSDNHLSTRIKKLSPLLINQLAAGEVVTRPAAVVKELLENAVDAGATHIEVCITQGGMGLIEVIDNGSGIHPDDMIMAVTRHATSKVADIANLHGISTLGFRGEALAATAAVSRLTLSSSHDNSGIGRQLQMAGVLADTSKLMPVVHQRGTTIKVRDLYFNVPARRGNIKSLATEFMHIETVVREVAIARADVTLTLYHDQKKRLQLCASAENNIGSNFLPLSRLEQALGMSLKDQALEVLVDLSNLVSQAGVAPEEMTDDKSINQAKISGWIWPNQDKMAGLPKLLYVNGRLIKDTLISNHLRQIGSSVGCDSIHYALYFELPYEWLNLNVHPTKQRIKISPLNNILAHLGHVVRTVLSRLAPSASSAHHPITANQSTTSEVVNIKPFSQASHSVQAPTNPYSVSSTVENKNTAKDHEYSLAKSDLNNEAGNTLLSFHNQSIDSIVHSNKHIKLPLCLEVIHSVEDNWQLDDNDNDNDNSDDKTLPWLLFFSQNQWLLISEQEWYSRINSLFDSNWFKRSDSVSTADSINQHLNHVAEQMSASDLRAFTVDVAHILESYAIKAVSTSQLLTLLLAAPIASP
ncbi:DNA mismatch repair endonuclease MutL [Psychrobacter sp. DM4]|uniref:DNA mismatch repair endonuclease MutL n=1 Tax=Psychrobacter sp. DM4 TaxID=3440637 RepID=UPI003F4FDB91